VRVFKSTDFLQDLFIKYLHEDKYGFPDSIFIYLDLILVSIFGRSAAINNRSHPCGIDKDFHTILLGIIFICSSKYLDIIEFNCAIDFAMCGSGKLATAGLLPKSLSTYSACWVVAVAEAGEKIIWNFDNVQKAYATRGYEAKKQVS
jgi:hypothetical protein